MISAPLQTETPFTVRTFAEEPGATTVISFDTTLDKFTSFVPQVFSGDGFPIEGGQGYIVNALEAKNFTFTGTGWWNAPSEQLATLPGEKTMWAFVVVGTVFDEDGQPLKDVPIYSDDEERHLIIEALRKIGGERAAEFAYNTGNYEQALAFGRIVKNV